MDRYPDDGTRKVYPAKSIDALGRCCGRKPLVYKRPPRLFCCRCGAQFDMDGRQVDNYAFRSTDGGQHLVFVHKHMEDEVEGRK